MTMNPENLLCTHSLGFGDCGKMANLIKPHGTFCRSGAVTKSYFIENVNNACRYIDQIVSMKHQYSQSSSHMKSGTAWDTFTCLAVPICCFLGRFRSFSVGSSRTQTQWLFCCYCVGQHMGSHRA